MEVLPPQRVSLREDEVARRLRHEPRLPSLHLRLLRSVRLAPAPAEVLPQALVAARLLQQRTIGREAEWARLEVDDGKRSRTDRRPREVGRDALFDLTESESADSAESGVVTAVTVLKGCR